MTPTAPQKAVPPVREWRLHLGVHKTATTHLQYRLQALAPELAQRGVDVLVPEGGVRACNLSRVAESWPRLWRLRPMQTRRLTDLIDGLRTGPDRVLISEEQMLGRLGPLLQGRPYNPQGYIAALIGALSRRAETHLFLALRAYDTFLPSAYAQGLRHNPPPKGGFAATCRAFAQPGMGWLPLVESLRRAAPQARLTIWRYEDYKANADTILTHLCGTELRQLPEVPPPARTSAGSAKAVARAETLPATLTGDARRKAVGDIYADPSQDGPRYDPLDADSRAALKARYVADWDAICRMAPDSVLNFTAHATPLRKEPS